MVKYIDSILRNNYIKEHKKNYFLNKKLEVKSIVNGYVLPIQKIDGKTLGGVLDNNKKYIKISAQLAFNMNDRVNGYYNIDNYDVDYIDETVIYFNYFYEHWGHFLIDMVSRLWYIVDSKKKYKIVVPVDIYKDIKISGNYLEFLKILNINEEHIIMVNKPTKFKKIIIPECSIYPGKYYTKEYKKIFEYLLNKVEVDTSVPDNIYLSRNKFKKAHNKEKGEYIIEKCFNNNNFISIYPEKLSFVDQIKYYNNCKKMVCINGTLSHNILFLNKKAKVIIINKTYKLNKIQEMINQLTGIEITYIDCHISLLPIAYGKGPFIIFKNKNLNNFLKDNNYRNIKVHFYIIKSIYYKLWYIIKYLKIYNFKIYHDKYIDDIKITELLKKYLLR